MKGWQIFIGILVIGFFCAWLPFFFLPGEGLGVALPVIYVPGEALRLYGQFPGTDVDITNTFVAAVLTSIITMGLVLSVASNPKEVPGRGQALVEMIVEVWEGLARNAAGAKGRQLLPLALSIFFFLLVANVMKIIPGVDSIGELHCAGIIQGEGENETFVQQPGYPLRDGEVKDGLNLLRVEKDPDKPINTGTKITREEYDACHHEMEGEEAAESEEEHEDEAVVAPATEEGEGGEGGEAGEAAQEEEEHAEEEAHAENPGFYIVTPFVRGATTDLALTVAIAILAIITVEYFGIKELGIGGWGNKFINIGALDRVAKGDLMGIMDFAVSLLELFLEFFKIVSFAFRLFGSMFGGAVLMFVITFLLAAFVPLLIIFLEVFFGAIQAFVFAILFIMFATQAMTSHSHDDHEHEEAHAH